MRPNPVTTTRGTVGDELITTKAKPTEGWAMGPSLYRWAAGLTTCHTPRKGRGMGGKQEGGALPALSYGRPACFLGLRVQSRPHPALGHPLPDVAAVGKNL